MLGKSIRSRRAGQKGCFQVRKKDTKTQLENKQEMRMVTSCTEEP